MDIVSAFLNICLYYKYCKRTQKENACIVDKVVTVALVMI